MDEKKLKTLSDYCYYHDNCQKLGAFPLHNVPTLDEMGITRACLQALYRGIKETGFEGGITDYLCAVSLRFLVKEGVIRKIMAGEVKFSEEETPLEEEYVAEIKNSLRLFLKNPALFFKTIGVEATKEDFLTLSELHYFFFTKPTEPPKAVPEAEPASSFSPLRTLISWCAKG